MKASLVFYPNTGKQSSKNQKIPVYVRVRLGNKKCERRLKIEILKTQGIDYRSSLIPAYLNNRFPKEYLDRY